jgi:RNA recognition motif-containing protein
MAVASPLVNVPYHSGSAVAPILASGMALGHSPIMTANYAQPANISTAAGYNPHILAYPASQTHGASQIKGGGRPLGHGAGPPPYSPTTLTTTTTTSTTGVAEASLEPPADRIDRIISISNLPYNITISQIQTDIRPFGKVEICQIRRIEGSSRATAFAQFSSANEAVYAQNVLDGRGMHGRRWIVKLAKEDPTLCLASTTATGITAGHMPELSGKSAQSAVNNNNKSGGGDGGATLIRSNSGIRRETTASGTGTSKTRSGPLIVNSAIFSPTQRFSRDDDSSDSSSASSSEDEKQPRRKGVAPPSTNTNKGTSTGSKSSRFDGALKSHQSFLYDQPSPSL